MSIHRALFSVFGSLLTSSMLLAASASPALAIPVPAHVSDAETLLAELTVSRQNVYASSPSYINWNGNSSQARTVCGTFITNLLLHSYKWTTGTFTQWMGTTSPYAETYHDAILAQNNFTWINNIQQVQPGDIIAVKYVNSSVTGHAMMVDSFAKVQSAIAPIIAGTIQYAVTVIDSSSLHHGAVDTRVTSPSTTGNGIGKGDIRIYVDSTLAPVGYTWANESGSQYYSMTDRPLAIGRIDLAHFGVPVPPMGGGGGSGAPPQLGDGGTAGNDGGTTSPPQVGTGEVSTGNDPIPDKTDDDTLAPANASAASGADAALAGGCSLAAHAQTGTAGPEAFMALAMLLGLFGLRRRHSRAIRQAGA